MYSWAWGEHARGEYRENTPTPSIGVDLEVELLEEEQLELAGPVFMAWANLAWGENSMAATSISIMA
jgi:hypothetical protein